MNWRVGQDRLARVGDRAIVASKRAGLVLLDNIGAEEVFVAIGILCVIAGLWLVSHAAALVTAGAILLWIGLPARPPFIQRSKPPEGR